MTFRSTGRRTLFTAQSLSSPILLGILSALAALAFAVAVCVVPSLASDLAADRSSVSTLGAILLGLDAVILGHGGALILGGGVITGTFALAPLGLTALFAWAGARIVRRRARSLALVEADGGLRAGGVRDAGAMLAAHTIVYAGGVLVIAAVAASERARPALSSALMTGIVVGALAGLLGLAGVLRDSMPLVEDDSDRASRRRRARRRGVLTLLPRPYDALVRGLGMALAGLIAAGLLVVSAAVLIRLPHAAALFDQLQPGIVGGAVLTLIQLALLPTFALWALAALLGGTFSIGLGSSVGLAGSTTSALPAFPVLGALPGPGSSPWFAWLLLLLPVAAIGTGAVSVVREVSDLDLRRRAIAWAAYPIAVIAGTLVMLAISGGRIGAGRLQTLGPDAVSALPGLALIALGTTGLAILVCDATLREVYRGWTGSLRTRVERAEAQEAAPTDDARTEASGAAQTDDESADAPASAPGTSSSRTSSTEAEGSDEPETD